MTKSREKAVGCKEDDANWETGYDKVEYETKINVHAYNRFYDLQDLQQNRIH